MAHELRLPTPKIVPTTFLSLAEMRVRASAEPKGWLLENIIPAAGVTLLVAPAYAGKSRWLAAVSVAVATGQPFCGRTTKQGRVLWLYLEHRITDLVENLDGAMRGLGVTADPDIGLMDLPRGFDLESTAQLAPIVALIEQSNPILVIVDSLRRAGSHEENDSDDVKAVCARLDRMAGNRLAVVGIQHSGLDGYRPRGSGDWEAGTDSCINLRPDFKKPDRLTVKTRHHSAGPDTLLLTVNHSKDPARLVYAARQPVRLAGSSEGNTPLENAIVALVREFPGQSTKALGALLRKKKIQHANGSVSPSCARLVERGVLRTEDGQRGATLHFLDAV